MFSTLCARMSAVGSDSDGPSNGSIISFESGHHYPCSWFCLLVRETTTTTTRIATAARGTTTLSQLVLLTGISLFKFVFQWYEPKAH